MQSEIWTLIGLFVGSAITLFLNLRVLKADKKKTLRLEWLKNIYIALIEYRYLPLNEASIDAFNKNMALLTLLGTEEQSKIVKKIIDKEDGPLLGDLLDSLKNDLRKELGLKEQKFNKHYLYHDKNNGF